MIFKDLGFESQLQEGLDMMGFDKPTPIQEQAIPAILQNKDIIACAQTGTGKTAAFVLPILNKLCKRSGSKINTIIVSPTRELALQIDRQIEGFSYFTNASSFPIYGGGTGPDFDAQKNAIKNGADILVCTPGRLLAHMKFNYFDASEIKHFILDEADRMLDMGFIHDIKKIIAKLPKKRQSLFFSATMPQNILELSKQILVNPEKVAVNAISSAADTIQQYLYTTNKNNKKELLLHILKDSKLDQVLLFSRTKHGADKIVTNLKKKNINCAAIHGDRSQNQRQRALKDFKDGKIRLLVATDIAARGIDISKLRYVINYDIPNEPETYVHRIGRCGRAGEEGISISICEPEENAYIRNIEKLIKQKIKVISSNPFPQTDKPMTTAEKKEFEKQKQKRKQEFFANRNKKKNQKKSGFKKYRR